MGAATVTNLVAIWVQVACVVIAAGVTLALLRVTSPRLSYYSWRIVIALCLALPWLQTPQATPIEPEQVIAADPASAPLVAGVMPAVASSIDWSLVVVSVLVLGAAVRLLWVGIGLRRLQRLRLSGESMPASEHDGLQRAIGTNADVRYVEQLAQPATFGWRRPVVLLPITLRDQASLRDAVLAHELIHVQRRDWNWVIAEEITRAVCWFQPALWWAITRVQLAREEVVDACAAAITGNRRAYLRALLTFADADAMPPAPAFARRRHLFRRIVLLSMEDAMSPRRIALCASLVVAMLMFTAWSSMSAFPTQAATASLMQSQPGLIERDAKLTSPENPIPAIVHREEPVRPPSGDAHVTVTLRTVIDQSGNVVEVRLATFSYTDVAGGTPVIGGPESVATFPDPSLRDFIEAAAHAVQQSRYEAPAAGPALFTTITEFRSGETAAVSRTLPMVQRVSAEGAIKVGGAVRAPRRLKDARPIYPTVARAAGVQGVVILELRVESDGKVGSAGVLRSIPALDQAALDAVYQWEFEPTLLNGAPVPVILVATIQFRAN